MCSDPLVLARDIFQICSPGNSDQNPGDFLSDVSTFWFFIYVSVYQLDPGLVCFEGFDLCVIDLMMVRFFWILVTRIRIS